MIKKNLLLILIFLFISCSSSDSFLLLRTQYNTFDFEEKPESRAKLKQILRNEQLTFNQEFLTDKDDIEQTLTWISGKIEKPAVKYIAIDPLVNFSLNSVIIKYPAKLFISYKIVENMHFPNLLKVEYNKVDSLRKAGIMAAILFRQKYQLLMERQAPGEKIKLGLIYYNLLPGQNGEINAFKEGFVKDYNEEDLLAEEVRDINDRNDINTKLDKFIHNGVVLVFPRLYHMNPYCLDLAVKKGSMIITENWHFTDTQIDKSILFSINDYFTDSVQEILKLKTLTENKASKWERNLVNVKPRIVWGQAGEIPEAVRAVLAE